MADFDEISGSSEITVLTTDDRIPIKRTTASIGHKTRWIKGVNIGSGGSLAAGISTADSLTFNPGTPVSNAVVRANAGPGTYVNFLSGPGAQITVDSSDGQVDFIFSTITGYWTKVINPLMSIANDLVTNSASKALSAAQGFKLSSQIQGSIQGTGTININSNGSITVAGELYGVIGGTYLPGAIPAATTAGLTSNSFFAGINYIYLNVSTKEVYLANYSAINSIDLSQNILIGWIFDRNLSTLATTSNITVDGLNRSLTQILSFLNQTSFVGLFNSSYSINIDSTAHKITFSEAWLLAGNETLHIVAGETNYVGTPGTLTVLIYNRSNSLIYLVNHDEASAFYFTTHVSFGALWGWDVETLQVNGRISVDGRFKGEIGNVATGEIVLPPKFWLINGHSLPLYKTSIVRSYDELTNEIYIANFAESTSDFGFPKYDKVDTFTLVPASLKPTVRIYSKNYKVTGSDYSVDIAVNSIAATAKDGQTKTWWPWGDSLMNRNIADRTKGYISTFSSITVNTAGTMANGANLGEGREGWTSLNFIGKDNQHLGDNIVISRLSDGSTSSGIYNNPYLKLATSSDKSNNPDRCFRNTGSISELSYASDTDKSGNFYIFDVSYYMSQHSVPSPNLITIALITNNFSKYGFSQATIDDALFALEVMLTQIKYALPTVKIGVIPMTPVGDNAETLRFTYNCKWANQVNLKLTSLALSNVEVVGVHAHMNRNFNFDYGTAANLQSDGNLTKVLPKGDYIHFNENGKLEYAKALAAYIMNVI